MRLDQILAGLLPVMADLCQTHLRRCERIGIPLLVTCGWRSPEEQTRLYAIGRHFLNGAWVTDNPRITVTRALPDKAPHCRGAAYDIVPIVAEKAAWERLDLFQAIADQAKGLPLVWGGSWPSFKDLPHYELPMWRDLPLKEK